MVDSSWENQAPAPRSSGGFAWGKVLMGCGLAAALGIGALVVRGIAVANQKMNDPRVREELGRSLWPMVKELAEDLQTDDGARSLYVRNRGLRERFPTEEAFLAAARTWRLSLATLPPGPDAPGAFETRVSFQGMRLLVRLGDGRHLAIRLQGRGRHRLPVRDMEVQ